MGTATAEAQERSAADLIRFLTFRSDRPHKGNALMGLFTCGQTTADLEAATSLAKLGNSAIPEIERALEAIEKPGNRWKYGSQWLARAYAKIKGPAAYPRLRRMEGDPKLGLDRDNFDTAIALSFGLTSYVSDSLPRIRSFSCARGPEPRDPLNQLILGWETNDRRWLQASLGPSARAALNSLLAGRTWGEMRADLWRDKSGSGVAVGYRFEVPGRWSEPDHTLEEETGDVAAPIMEGPHFDLDTQFTNRSGGDCGRHSVKFIETPAGVGPGHLMYLVDNSDIGDLLSLISACAAQTGESP